MINGHFILNTKDVEGFRDLKNSTLYTEYMNSVAESPIISEIIHEHVDGLNIESDVQKLKDMGASNKDFSSIFVSSLKKIANRIVADTIILKELTEITIDDIKNDLSDSFRVKYTLGLADKHYYDAAEKKLKNSPNTSSVLYHGLVEYKKKSGDTQEQNNDIKKIVKKKKKVKKAPIKHKQIHEDKESFNTTGLDL